MHRGHVASGTRVDASGERCACGNVNQEAVASSWQSLDESRRLRNLYALWADHRDNTNPNCDFRTSPVGNGSPPCDHDILYSLSTNRGAPWSPTISVTPRSRLGENAQWQPWSDVMGDGSILQAAFYDRHYGNCETTGCNDVTLATIENPRSPSLKIKYRRITTTSMPNPVTANNPIQAGFIGDYMWVEVSRHNFGQRTTHIVRKERSGRKSSASWKSCREIEARVLDASGDCVIGEWAQTSIKSGGKARHVVVRGLPQTACQVRPPARLTPAPHHDRHDHPCDHDGHRRAAAYVGKSARFTASCYLLKHGDTYMLWDAGFAG